jgi:hypothetical protein
VRLYQRLSTAVMHLFTKGNSTARGDDTFMSVVKAAAAKSELHAPTIMAADNGERIHRHLHGSDEDDAPVPLAHNRWFQASAKAVRMSVLEHIERGKARSQVSEQLRVWASEKVQQYSRVRVQVTNCAVTRRAASLQDLPWRQLA